jgi:hypothetical protein
VSRVSSRFIVSLFALTIFMILPYPFFSMIFKAYRMQLKTLVRMTAMIRFHSLSLRPWVTTRECLGTGGWTATAGTRPFASGTATCKKMVRSKPSSAIKCASATASESSSTRNWP